MGRSDILSKESIKFYKITKTILKPIFKFWFNPKVYGKENIPMTDEPVLIASNHTNFFDPCVSIISTKRVIYFISKKELFEGKMGWFFHKMCCIPVDRSIKNPEAIDKAINILKNNGTIGIFPEGTRNRTEDILLPFKYGAMSMAKKTNAWVVPVAVKGKFKFRSKNLVIRYGRPFKVDDMTVDKATDKLRKKILELLDKSEY